jgi:hypothetical protein
VVTNRDLIEPVAVALVDLRATLEAQLRLLTAAEVCLECHDRHPSPGALVHCAQHLQRFSSLNEASATGLQEAAAALKRILDVPEALVLPPSSLPSTEE